MTSPLISKIRSYTVLELFFKTNRSCLRLRQSQPAASRRCSFTNYDYPWRRSQLSSFPPSPSFLELNLIINERYICPIWTEWVVHLACQWIQGLLFLDSLLYVCIFLDLIKKGHMQTWKIWLLSFPLIYQFALCQMADSNFEKGDVKHTCPTPVGKSFFARTTLYTYTTTRDQDVAGQVYFKSLWQEKKRRRMLTAAAVCLPCSY